MVAGLSAVAANDLWIFVTGQPATAAGPALLYQGGLLLLVGAAATPAVRFSDDVDTTVPFAAVLGAVPFLPLLLCMVATARIAVRGDGLAPDQVLPALAVAIALTLRQFAGSRDKQRLVRQLQAREVGLQAALRIDGLTGLANRLGVAERLDSALSDPAQWPVSVALLDLNEFKLINDNHGHPVGDEVLRVVAARLSRVVRGDDTVARLGGDEFAIITTAVDERQRELLQARLIAAFDEPIQAGGQRFSVHASIGIVVGRPPDTPAQLLAHADAAMYRAKDGRGYDSRAAVLDDAGRADVARQLRVREAIADPDLTQFQVHYQPVVDLATGHIRAFEALLRWRHPDLGPVPPDTFIPLAEQSGSIGTIGQFVLEQATADLAKIVRARPERQLVVSVNVSPRQLSDEAFVTRTLRLLADRGLRPDQLALEVTEQAFEANLGPVADTVAALAAAGVHVAVDDFGTGYSSLRYLQRLRLDIMKIDRSFVDEIDGTAADQLVPAVTTMAAGLGLQVVAEGIETLDQLRLLQQINCELGQGYLFSAPMPIAQLERLIAEGHTYQVGAGDAAPLLPSPRRVDDTGVRVSDRTPRDS
jgi:diguanylate cyclase (GGDEF)-like protein